MKAKDKIKLKTNPVSVYLTEAEHKELIEITNEKNISLTDYMRDAMILKMNNDSNNLEKETDELLIRLASRIKEVSPSDRLDVLGALYKKTADRKARFIGQTI